MIKYIKVALCLWVFTTPAFALNVQHFRPSLPYQNMAQTIMAQTMQNEGFALSVFANYVDEPLRFDSGMGDLNVIQSVLTYDLSFAVFVNSRLTLHTRVSFSPLISSNTALSNLVQDRALGDSVVGALWRLNALDRDTGVALLSQVEIPTGDADSFVGSEGWGARVVLVADRSFQSAVASVNLGIIKRFDEDEVSNLEIQDQWELNLGLRKDFASWSWGGEFYLKTDLTSPFGSEAATPMEVSSFASKMLTDHTRMFAGAGFGLMSGYGNANWRVFFGLTWDGVSSENNSTFNQEALSEIRTMMEENAKEQPVTDLMSTVHFESNQSHLMPESMHVLNPYVKIMKESADTTLHLVGHSDSEGTDHYNLELSRERAQSVKRFFVVHGIDPNRITVEAKGEQELLYEETRTYDRLLNRRVELKLESSL